MSDFWQTQPDTASDRLADDDERAILESMRRLFDYNPKPTIIVDPKTYEQLKRKEREHFREGKRSNEA